MAQGSNPNRDITLVAFLLLFLGIGGTYYYLMPRLVEAREQYQDRLATEAGLARDIAALEQAQATLTTRKAELAIEGVDLNNLEAIRKVYPKTEEIPEVYLQMEKLVADAKDVTGVSYTVGQPTEATDTSTTSATTTASTGITVPVTFEAIGQYAPLKQFLTHLETNIRPLTVTSLTLSTDEGSSDQNSQATVPEGSYKLSVTAVIRAEALSPAYAPETETGSAAPIK